MSVAASTPPSPASSPTATSVASALERRFALWLALVVAVGVGLGAWILAQAWRENPFTAQLQADAKIYWEWAGRIAEGLWVADEPFHVPPLYAYALAAIRAAGGGLLSAYVAQLLAAAATAALVGAIGRRLFGAPAGLIAAALYVACEDVAFFVQRLSPPTLQALLIAWLWWELCVLGPRSGAVRGARVGIALGLAVLANPVMLPAAVVVAAWLALRARRGRLGWPAVAGSLVFAALAVAPAPLHNWSSARELIPVSTQGGLAFAIGNAAGANGTYHPIEGVSVLRDRQDRDALALARRETGEPELGWNGADRYFYARGLSWWAANPLDAAGLLARKAWWFFSGRHYSDSYMPTLEVESGFASRLRFAFVRVHWLALAALVGLAWLRRDARFVPTALMLALPLAAIVVYHYSSRYRAPALPAIAVLSAGALVLMLRAGTPRAARIGAAIALAIGLGVAPINRAIDFDSPEHYRPSYEHLLGATWLSANQPLRAAPHLQRALELGELASRPLLAEVLRAAGQVDRARALAEQSLAEGGEASYAARVMARILADQGDYARAAEFFARALEAEPTDVESHLGLGSCSMALGQPAKALEHYEIGLELDPSRADIAYLRGLALASLGRAEEAEAAYREVIEHGAPGSMPEAMARVKLIELWIATGDHARALQMLEARMQAQPNDGDGALMIAWIRATAPDASLRDGAFALRIAQMLQQQAPNEPRVLDVLAAALAESGMFEPAAEAAQTAERLAREAQDPAFADQIAARAALYRASEPYRSAPAAR